MSRTRQTVGSSAKLAGVRGRGGSGSDVDWLSALPDCLLHAVLSFLESRQAVRTSVLSKRWTDLWRSMPCIDVDRRATRSPGGDSDGRKFRNFVDNLLLFHDDAPVLDTFRLHLDLGGSRTAIIGKDESDRWIRRGVKYCPSVLEIDLGSNCDGVRLPSLGSCSHRLKRLYLSDVSLDASFAQQVHFGCPVLEDLELKSCECAFLGITSHTLKILTLDGCFTNLKDALLIITAPALTSFHLAVSGEEYRAGISVNEAANLVQVSMCVHENYRGSYFQKNLRKLLDGLSSARNLQLKNVQTMEPIDEKSEKFPSFSNLRTLLLDRCDISDNFQTVEHFLQNAPNLEKLLLQYCVLHEGSKKRKTKEKPKRISLRCQDLTFQCPKLKTTEIKYKEDDVHQLFDLLFGIWRNLQRTTLVLTKD